MRHFLRRMEARLKEFDLNIETGFEIEFFLLEPTGEPTTMPVPVDDASMHPLPRAMYGLAEASMVLSSK